MPDIELEAALADLGVTVPTPASSTPQGNVSASAPTANDDSGDGYEVGSRWIQVGSPAITSREWVCIDATVGAAVWIDLKAEVPTGTQGLLDQNVGQGFDSRTKRVSPIFYPLVGSEVTWTHKTGMNGGATQTGLRKNGTTDAATNYNDNLPPSSGSQHSMIVPATYDVAGAYIYLWTDGGYNDGYTPGDGTFVYWPVS